jgi:hypothetical protein
VTCALAGGVSTEPDSHICLRLSSVLALLAAMARTGMVSAFSPTSLLLLLGMAATMEVEEPAPVAASSWWAVVTMGYGALAIH